MFFFLCFVLFQVPPSYPPPLVSVMVFFLLRDTKKREGGTRETSRRKKYQIGREARGNRCDLLLWRWWQRAEQSSWALLMPAKGRVPSVVTLHFKIILPDYVYNFFVNPLQYWNKPSVQARNLPKTQGDRGIQLPFMSQFDIRQRSLFIFYLLLLVSFNRSRYCY